MPTGNLIYLLLITWLAINAAQSCSDGEKTRAPYSCRQYDECINGELVRKKCNLAKYFDGQQCDYLWKVKCTVDNCEDGQKYPRGICKKDYYYCLYGKVTKQNCPKDSVFDGQRCVNLELCTNATKEIKKETKLTDMAAEAKKDSLCN
uniref:Putative peritrophin n=1 Tax=Panstrongylus lignarius TaxID=156445 RepID=A0A224Y072_9HEMI